MVHFLQQATFHKIPRRMVEICISKTPPNNHCLPAKWCSDDDDDGDDNDDDDGHDDPD